MMDPTVFCALAAIGWADGVMTEDERYAIVRAAWDSGLRGADLDPVVAATQEPADMWVLRLSSLKPGERLFVYAAGLAIARADGRIEEEERSLLESLRERLGLDDVACGIAEAAVFAAPECPYRSAAHPDRTDVRRVVDFTALADSLAFFSSAA
jgi:tellurite resistance protein